jgi:cholesterol transport system auxiliary component
MRIHISIPIISLLILSACGGGGIAAERYILYSIDASSNAETTGRVRDGTLKIVLPVASPGLDTTQIAVLQKGGRLNNAAGKEWAEPLPKLVQAQLVEAFDQARLFQHTVPDSQGVVARYSLMTDIREFAFDQTEDAGRVRVRMVSRLVNPATRKVIFSVSSLQIVPVGEKGVIEALSVASTESVREITQKIAGKLR